MKTVQSLFVTFSLLGKHWWMWKIKLIFWENTCLILKSSNWFSLRESLGSPPVLVGSMLLIILVCSVLGFFVCLLSFVQSCHYLVIVQSWLLSRLSITFMFISCYVQMYIDNYKWHYCFVLLYFWFRETNINLVSTTCFLNHFHQVPLQSQYWKAK